MNMNDIIKFIKNNQGYINEEMFKELYDEAYEWLTDEQTAELTKMLDKALNMEAEKYARDSILEKFTMELQNFKASRNETVVLSTFIRMYMNHLNGIDYDEFAHLISVYLTKYPQPGVEIFDDGFDLYIKQVY